MKSIILIAPNKQILTEGKTLQKTSFKNIKVCSGLMQEGVKQALKESKNGAEIFVTRARTAQAITEAKIPGVVVNIQISAYDILRAITAARKIDQKIAIVAFAEMIDTSEVFAELLAIDLPVFTYETESQAEASLKQALTQGAKVIIGGETTQRIAKKFEVPFVQIVTGQEAIVQALEEAERIQTISAREKNRMRFLEILTNSSSEGILIIGPDLKISICNNLLCQMAKLEERQIIGKSLPDIWPEINIKKILQNNQNQDNELTLFRKMEVLVNTTLIQINQQLTGIVFSLQEIEEIRKKEATLRQSIYTPQYQAKYSFKDVLGTSNSIKQTVQQGKEFALTNSPIFLIGEIGVGKNLFAQSIHQYSKRSSGTYVEIKCAALKGKLFEQEIYGKVATKGSSGTAGLLEIAHKGTVFLQEITELDLEAQGKLLTILQEQKITRIGSEQSLPIDVRIIASTSKDIKKAIYDSNFRADLYYQLNVLQLKIPSLAERREDIKILAQAFLKKFNPKKDFIFHKDALNLLSRRNWNGNGKELLNIMERIAVTCRNEEIKKSYLQEILGEDVALSALTTHEILKNDKIEEIRQAIKDSKGNYGLAAKKLHIDRSTLWRRMKRLGLK